MPKYQDETSALKLASIETDYPEVYQYTSAEACLKDLCQYFKNNENLSLRSVAKRSGISVSLLSLFLSGKRSLAPKSMEKLLDGLPLPGPEKVFLRLLLITETSTDHNLVISILNALRDNEDFKNAHPQSVDFFEYLSNPLNVVIREMIQFAEFNESPSWIQQQLKIGFEKSAIEKSLAFLESRGFVTRDESGRLQVANKKVACHEKILRLSLIEYHTSMLSGSMKLIQNRDVRNKISGQTLVIADEHIDEVKKIIDEAAARLSELEKKSVAENRANTVLQVELVAIPLTGKGVEGE